MNIDLNFIGPYSWINNIGLSCIFTAEECKKSGIYLWTVKTSIGELVYYVGETGRNFSIRMYEHFQEHMSGGYHLYNPEQFIRGNRDCIWPGRYERERKTTVTEFMESYSKFNKTIEELVKIYHFFIAPIQVEKRIRERIESGIANYFYSKEGIIGAYQEKGIRYTKKREGDEEINLTIDSDPVIIGFPVQIRI